MKSLAVDWIEKGFDSPQLHELAWEPVCRHAEAEALFIEITASIGVTTPTSDEAVWVMLRFYAERITAPSSEPPEELRRMMDDVYWPFVSAQQSTQYVGDSHDMQEFIGAYWGFDDLKDAPDTVGYNGAYGDAAFAAFTADTRDVAVKWLAQHRNPQGEQGGGGQPATRSEST